MVFILIRRICKDFESSRIIVNISNLAFGVYLVHPLIMEFLSGIGISAIAMIPIAGIPLTIGLTLILSGGIVALLRSSKITRYIVP